MNNDMEVAVVLAPTRQDFQEQVNAVLKEYADCGGWKYKTMHFTMTGLTDGGGLRFGAVLEFKKMWG